MALTEKLIDKGGVVAFALWVVVAVLLLASWVVMWADRGQWRWSLLLAATAAVFSAYAAVMHVRTYFVRTFGLLRAIGGLDESPDSTRQSGQVHPIGKGAR